MQTRRAIGTSACFTVNQRDIDLSDDLLYAAACFPRPLPPSPVLASLAQFPDPLLFLTRDRHNHFRRLGLSLCRPSTNVPRKQNPNANWLSFAAALPCMLAKQPYTLL